tara:strand:- start:114 stop:356 length:243 start_codon:yes stop_codon:yes gene_type:complete
MPKARDYKKEYADYHGTPAQKKRRAARNASRSKAEDEGKVHKGDEKEVDHVGSHRTGDLRKVATKVVSKKTNRKKQPKRS